MLAFWITLVVQGCTLFGILWINYHYSENSKDKMKYLIYLTVFSMVLIMILFETEPFGLKKALSNISGGHGGDWLQFWGTYLGIIFSVVLTLYVTIRQSEYDRENSRSNHVSEIYLSTLIEINEKMSEIMSEYNGLRNGLSFQKSTNEFDKYAQMSRAIKSIQSHDAERHKSEIFNLLAIIPTDRKCSYTKKMDYFYSVRKIKV